MADADIPMGVEQLATCLLTDGPWFRDFLQRRSTFGIEAGDFEDESGVGSGQVRRPGVRRNIRYWLRINYAIGPKQTLVEETQTYVWCEPGKVHIIDCEARNRDVPYGTSFHTLNRMCLTSLGSGRSHLTITSRIVFTRHVFLAKGFIESNVREGSKTYFRLMVDTLLDPNAGKLPINDEEGPGGSDNGGAAGSRTSAAGAASPSSLKIPSSSSPKQPAMAAAATRQESVGRHRPSANSASAAASAAATATAGRRSAQMRSGGGRSRNDQRLLLVCLLIASVLMLGCLFSLHLRFQSLDRALARLQQSNECSRSACVDSNFFTSPNGGRSAFTREQLDIWRRALDKTMGSLDGLLFELRRLTTAATPPSNTGGGSVCAPPRS